MHSRSMLKANNGNNRKISLIAFCVPTADFEQANFNWVLSGKMIRTSCCFVNVEINLRRNRFVKSKKNTAVKMKPKIYSEGNIFRKG